MLPLVAAAMVEAYLLHMETMRRSGKCPKCSGAEILENTRVQARSAFDGKDELHIVVYENPDALLFRGEHSSPLTAWVCRSCGFAELYCVELP